MTFIDTGLHVSYNVIVHVRIYDIRIFKVFVFINKYYKLTITQITYKMRDVLINNVLLNFLNSEETIKNTLIFIINLMNEP